MRLCQGYFFIIKLVFSQKCGWSIMTSLVWLVFPCNWIRRVIRRCFQRGIWVRWGREIRRNFIIILCHKDTFLLSHCIIMTQYVFQFFLSLVYHENHIRGLWILIFVRVKSMSQVTIRFFSFILCWRLIKTKNMIMQFIILLFMRVLNNLMNK